MHGAAAVTGAECTRHRRRGRVGEEDQEARHRLQDRARHPDGGEWCRAQVPDECGVGQQEERFDDERAECGQGEADDVAVDGSTHVAGVGVGRGGHQDILPSLRPGW